MPPPERRYLKKLTPEEVRRERERTEQRSKLLFEAIARDALDG